MKPRTRLRRLRIEATVALVIARLAVGLVPASRLLAWAARPPRHPDRFADPDLPALVAQAVDAVGSSRWMNALCLPRALAAQAMLRRRGIASRLCLGVDARGRPARRPCLGRDRPRCDHRRDRSAVHATGAARLMKNANERDRRNFPIRRPSGRPARSRAHGQRARRPRAGSPRRPRRRRGRARPPAHAHDARGHLRPSAVRAARAAR